MKTLPFVKYSGNGNDFIILDQVTPASELVQRLCDRHFGVGADGVLVLLPSSSAEARMRIYNADGGEAEMCANGLRCLVTYLDATRDEKKDSYLIETMNHIYRCQRKGASFAIEMSANADQNKYDLSSFTGFKKSFYVNTGVPHLVFLTDEVRQLDLKAIAPAYRYHSLFPKGTNVNFVEVLEENSAYVRSYERGVEDETFSCGTGLTASALALAHWLGWKGDIALQTKGGQQVVSIGESILYSGEVRHCFRGEFLL